MRLQSLESGLRWGTIEFRDSHVVNYKNDKEVLLS